MDSPIALVLSLGGVFLALAVVLYALIAPAPPARVAVTRSLDLVQHMNRSYDAAGVEEGSLLDRVLLPSLHRMAGLADRLSPQGYREWIRRGLDRAGNPERWTVQRILGAKSAGLIALGVLGLFYGSQLGPLFVVLGPVVGAAAGFYLPDLLVYNGGQRHQEQIRKSLAETIDTLTVCVEAGLGFDSALSQVARNTEGALARELLRVLQAIQIGTSRTDALAALAARTTVPELQSFISAIVQADGLGIPIADILREQSKELRVKRRQRAEEQAQKLPVKILFPMLLFVFPAFIVVIIGPGAIDIFHMFQEF